MASFENWSTSFSKSLVNLFFLISEHFKLFVLQIFYLVYEMNTEYKNIRLTREVNDWTQQ